MSWNDKCACESFEHFRPQHGYRLGVKYSDMVYAPLAGPINQGKHMQEIIQPIETIAVELTRHFTRESDDIAGLPDKPKSVD